MASMKLCVILPLMVFMIIFSATVAENQPMRHYVNGREGWVATPSQGYNQWAGAHRFEVNDTLYFRYDKKQDSVLVVNEQDYNSCNTDNPIMKQQNGESEINLGRSGAYYFISGNKTRCEQGEKMIVKVLSTQHPPPAPTPYVSPPAPAPKTSPIVSQPPSGLGPVVSPPSPSVMPPSPVTPVTPGPVAMGPGSGTPVTPGPVAMGPGSGTPVTPGPVAMSPGSGTPVTPGPVAMGPGSGTPATPGPAMSPGSSMPITSGPTMSPSSSTPGPAMSPSSVTPTGPAMSPGSMSPMAAEGPTIAASPSMSPMGGGPATSPMSGMSPAETPMSGMSPAETPMSGMSPAGTPMSGKSPANSPSDTAADASAPSGGYRLNRLTIVTTVVGVLSVSFALLF